jgi:hypothetical protein
MNRELKKMDKYDKLMYFTQYEELIEKHNINIVVDKLKLCYNVIDDEIIRYLEENRPETYVLYDFELIRIDGKHFNDTYQIVYNDLDKNGDITPHIFGELKFNLKSQSNEEDTQNQSSKVWIYVNNYILYSKDKRVIHLAFISEKLGIELNNVTGIEIAIDTNKSVPKRLKQYIRNKDIITILNGKTILGRKDDRPEIEYVHSGDMDKYKYMSIYLKQQKAINNKSNGTVICSYDKVRECKNSGKKYILDYYSNPNKLYRLEVRVTNENFKKFSDFYQIELIEPLFWNKGFLLEAFEYFLDSVIRFKSDSKNISIWDILY